MEGRCICSYELCSGSLDGGVRRGCFCIPRMQNRRWERVVGLRPSAPVGLGSGTWACGLRGVCAELRRLGAQQSWIDFQKEDRLQVESFLIFTAEVVQVQEKGD
jgi:hypothetical protein